VLPQH